MMINSSTVVLISSLLNVLRLHNNKKQNYELRKKELEFDLKRKKDKLEGKLNSARLVLLCCSLFLLITLLPGCTSLLNPPPEQVLPELQVIILPDYLNSPPTSCESEEDYLQLLETVLSLQEVIEFYEYQIELYNSYKSSLQ